MKPQVAKVLLMIGIFLTQSIYSNASQFISGDDVDIDEITEGDLYIGAGKVTVNAKVFGDLLIGGGNIVVSDSVTNDLMIGGGDISIDGHVGDDIRIAGGEITLKSDIAGDVIVFGGSVKSVNSIRIGGDLVVFGGEVDIDVQILGNVKMYAGDVSIKGKIHGDMQASIGNFDINAEVLGSSTIMADNLVLGLNTAFYDDVEYWTANGEQEMTPFMKNGTATFNPDMQRKRDKQKEFQSAFKKFAAGWFIYSILAGIVLIVVLHLLFKQLLSSAGDTYLPSFGNNILYGLLFFILTPFVAALAVATIIGIPLAFIGMGTYFIILAVSKPITALVLSNWARIRYGKEWSGMIIILAATGFFILMKVISLIPFAGWLVNLVLVFSAVGSLVYLIIKRKEKVAETPSIG